MAMKKSRYFTLKELCRSRTALRKGIDNFPSFEVVSHLEELVTILLEPLREAWGSPIAVTSGYRSPSLNRAVGGVRDSPHMKGYAADLVPLEKDAGALFAFAVEFLSSGGIPFDQILLETRGETSWVHLSLRSSSGAQRREHKRIVVR
ncbi:MAG: peptidase M15 [Bacteroidales bacterium]|nr:peptidase M15 [Bacteroidales bacterium]